MNIQTIFPSMNPTFLGIHRDRFEIMLTDGKPAVIQVYDRDRGDDINDQYVGMIWPNSDGGFNYQPMGLAVGSGGKSADMMSAIDPLLNRIETNIHGGIKEENVDDNGDAYKQAATEQYAAPSSDDIEIDANAAISESEDGAWVQAWVFVRKTDLPSQD